MNNRKWACLIVLATVAAATTASATNLGAAFKFQGLLRLDGSPFDGTANFRFELYDAPTGGVRLAYYPTPDGATVAIQVEQGLFTQNIDFGPNVFTGEARWLQIYVDGETLTPRQELAPAPHALALPGLWTQQNATSPNLIGGFAGNSVEPAAVGALIGGGGYAGAENRAFDSYCTVTGGIANRAGSDDGDATNARYATVVGGHSNAATGFRSVVIGGGFNSTTNGTIIGGSNNTATGAAAIILGSTDSTASGTVSTVVGGQNNAAGGPYSLAAGYRAKANHDGAMVFADHTEADFASTAANQFLIRAAGGTGINAIPDSGEALSVGGLIESTGGGFKFPDGTTQATAATGTEPSPWQLSGTDVYYNAGDVGIGLTDPLDKLDVLSAINVRGSSGTENWRLVTTSLGDLNVVDRETGSAAVVVKNGAPASSVRVASNGNVGIGATNPGNLLELEGDDPDIGLDVPSTSASYAELRFNVEGTTKAELAYLKDAQRVEITNRASGSAKKVVLNVDGNVGIGTSDPEQKLDVRGTAVSQFASGHNNNFTMKKTGALSANGNAAFHLSHRSNGLDLWMYSQDDQATRNFQAWDTSMYEVRFPADGDTLVVDLGADSVGIGNASPVYKLHVTENANSSAVYAENSGMGGAGAFRNSNASPLGTILVGLNATDPVFEVLNDGTTRVKVLEIEGADVAEKFPIGDKVEPGLVVEIDPDNVGHLRLASGAYNRRVAGVVSGAGGLPVGAVLGNLPGSEDSVPIAMSGRVWVYCDASGGAIEPGDLLTTSDTPGHAMKVTDYPRAQGAMIGKAMSRLADGRGLVLVLVSLQ